MKREIPTVHDMGYKLEERGLLKFGKRAHLQTGGNCYDVAQAVAGELGYTIPSKMDLMQILMDTRARHLGWGSQVISKPIPSPGVLIIRTAEACGDLHVSFSLQGREFNYGPGARDGFATELEIPVPRKCA